MPISEDTYETVKLSFDGRIATNGRIHLYEYSRSQYGLSRFITTIEQFRRTGNVIDRVTSGRTIDMIVSAPERGTFDLSVLIPVITETAPAVAGTSFKAIFSYVWSKLLPDNSKRAQVAIDLAKIERDREMARLKSSDVRDRAETERLALLADILKRKDATTEQLIGLLQRAIDKPDQKILARGYSLPELAQLEELAKADLIREKGVEQASTALAKLDAEKLDRLTNKLRPMVGEIALPLRRSADRCYLGNNANDNAYVRLTRERTAEVVGSRIDDTPIVFRGVLRSYDRYTYRGKIESDEFEKTMYFTVELDKRAELRSKVISAMRKREVEFTCVSYRSPSGAVTSLILRDIDIEG